LAVKPGTSLLRVARAFPTLGLNAIPAFGFLADSWSSSLTLAFYWVETVLATISVAALIVVHRTRTRRAGHWMGIELGGGSSAATRVRHGNSGRSLTDFLSVMVPFTAAQGIFIAILTFSILPSLTGGDGATLADLLPGVAAAAAFTLLGFLLDVIGIGSQPFAWIEATARGVVGRMIITHLTIIFGMGAMAMTDAPRGLFGVFVGLKTAVDLARRIPAAAPSRGSELPWWIVWLDRLDPRRKPTETWAESWEQAHVHWKRFASTREQLTADKERIVPRS
jgi:hypothetical protein